ncbi:MAG: hypothetical protein ACFFEX_02485 [Candidatus Thorarchaeota archaeon]
MSVIYRPSLVSDAASPDTFDHLPQTLMFHRPNSSERQTPSRSVIRSVVVEA